MRLEKMEQAELIHLMTGKNLKIIYNFTCLKCFKSEPEIKLTRDHKIPLTLGGTNNLDNIQPLCHSCNAKKSNTIWFASCPLS